MFELGPIGVGIGFEIAYPEWFNLKNPGFGISIGLIADTKGLGYYISDKMVDGRGMAFSLAPEVFYVHGINGNVDMSIIQGKGYSSELGLGPIGGEFGVDNSADYGQSPSYYMLSLTGLAGGIDLGFANWITHTSVKHIFYDD